MRRFIAWFFALLSLCTVLTFAGCKNKSGETPSEPAGTETPSGDDEVVNKDNSQKDDTADDIF